MRCYSNSDFKNKNFKPTHCISVAVEVYCTILKYSINKPQDQ